MANIPTNPTISTSATLDTSTVDSSNFATVVATAVSNAHPIQTRADQALWDSISGAYVAIQSTSYGTTTAPKNGQ